MAASNKDESSSPNEEDELDQITQHIEDLSITNDKSTIFCANCGKEVVGNPNVCNKCTAATYCNAACKKKHRHKHKEACERRVAELHEEQLERKKRAAELHDEKLFKQPPPNEDCPICMLPLPHLTSGSKYSTCCGKTICSGCVYAVKIRDGGVGLCPFCRTPTHQSNKEGINRIKKRVEVNDTKAMLWLGNCYVNGSLPQSLPQNNAKALELWHRAAELGNARAYLSIGGAYCNGEGVERDFKKANHYNQEAAMRGEIRARYSLGAFEERNAGNYDRALKHYMIAVRGGDKFSLNMVQEMFKHGHATKNDYTNALLAYQAYLDEIKSPQRDEAAAVGDDFKYY